MAVFRIAKTQNYTVMSNTHLRDKTLTLKAKGLLSQMLSLPEDWNYTLRGLAYINKERLDAIGTAVQELEAAGYVTREQGRDARGRMAPIVYTVYEQPQPPSSPCLENPDTDDPAPPRLENPDADNPSPGFPDSEKPAQLSKDINNKTDVSSIHPSIRAADDDSMDAMEAYRETLMENIGYDVLCQQYKTRADEIDELLELMLETVCSTKKTIRIGGEDKAAELVKAQMLRLDQSHLDYLMESLDRNTTDVRNIRGYLLTALYNAPATIGLHYKARVNHDLYGGT